LLKIDVVKIGNSRYSLHVMSVSLALQQHKVLASHDEQQDMSQLRTIKPD